jgi:glycosyltransferase involved in cell wall biosynthesis
MPRILRIINRFNLGGPTHNAAYLTRYLPRIRDLAGRRQPGGHRRGRQPHILQTPWAWRPLILPELQREVAPWRDRAPTRIKQLIKEFKPDIVHTHAAKAGPWGAWPPADLGVKAIVHTFHGHVFHSYFGPVRTAGVQEHRALSGPPSSRIIAISEKQKQRTGGRAPHLCGSKVR